MAILAHRITGIVLAQIILIIASFLVIVHFESQTNLAGNIVNVAGKNRVLTILVLEEARDELADGRTGGNKALAALDDLEENILFLKDGGTLHGIEIDALPSRFEGDWNEVWSMFVRYEKTVTGFATNAGMMGIDDVRRSGDDLVAISDVLTDKLGRDVDTLSSNLILLQGMLGAVNVLVHIFMILLILRILGRHAKESVRAERLSSIGELAASMAHDMKTPLGTIQNSAEIIRMRPDKPDVIGPATDRIMRSVRRLSHQIDGVMNYVRDVPLAMSDESIRGMLHRALESLQIPANVAVDLPQNDARVSCDPDKMELVFSNLLLNAVQALDGTDGNIRIDVDADVEGSTVIEFENSGPPIPTEDLPKVFEPLFTTKMQGTGLGLASCRNIMIQHGGEITAAGRPAKFTLRLPRKEAADDG